MKIRRIKKIRELYNEQGGFCAYCGTGMTLDMGFENTATQDHVRPVADGGGKSLRNIVAACFKCNQDKGKLPLLVWLAKREI